MLEINESLQELKLENQKMIETNNQKHQNELNEIKFQADSFSQKLVKDHNNEKSQLLSSHKEAIDQLEQDKLRLSNMIA